MDALPLQIFNAIATAKATVRAVDNKEHLVVPVIAMKVGVMNGFHYPDREISKLANTWNGVPVPIGHPQINGGFQSANQLRWEETINVGRLYNGCYEDEKLKGDIYIDIEKQNGLALKM